MLAGDLEGAIRISSDALATAEELGLDELRVRALTTIGSSMTASDREGGLRMLDEALAIAQAANSPLAAGVLNNIGFQTRDVERANELYRKAAEVAERFGDRTMTRFVHGNVIVTDFQIGRWDESVAAADAFLSESESSPHYSDGSAHVTRAVVRQGRGDITGSLEDLDAALRLARASKDLQALLPPLTLSAYTHALLGRPTEGRQFAAEAIDLATANPPWADDLWILACFADQLEIADSLRAALQRAPNSPRKSAVIAALDGDDGPLATHLAEVKDRAGEAFVHHMSGERLIRQGRHAEGEAELQRALPFYREVRATFFI
jgi:tetratricopeptide (TPR) repeat protein